MSGFFYFLPGHKLSHVSNDVLAKFGLSHIGDGEKLHHRGCFGPGRVEGTIVGSSLNWQPEEVKNSDAIEWVKFPRNHAAEQAWCGYRKDVDLPGAVDLKRVKQIDGKHLLLEDGGKWLIPNARVYTENGFASPLPRSFDLDEETGDWIAGQVLPKYRKIWEHANAYWDSMTEALQGDSGAGSHVSFSIPNAQQLVEDAFSVNYRVSSRELATLGVLTSGMPQLIAEILVDGDGFEKIKKKVVADTGAG